MKRQKEKQNEKVAFALQIIIKTKKVICNLLVIYKEAKIVLMLLLFINRSKSIRKMFFCFCKNEEFCMHDHWDN